MRGQGRVVRARRRLWLTLAVIGFSLMCVAPVARADQPVAFTVCVRLRVDRSVEHRIIRADLEDEVESLWRPYGVYFEWLDAAAPAAGTCGHSLDVIVEPSLLSKWTAVLGRAVVDVNWSNKPIEVSFEATAHVLASQTSSGTSLAWLSVRKSDMARALGRVLAHEIGHVLLAVPNHDTAGLMRANFHPQQLADPDRAPFRLTANDVGRLKSRIRILTAEASGF